MKYLYKKLKSSDTALIPEGLTVESFTPTIRRGLILPGERKSLRLLAVRLLFQLATHGRAKIYAYRENGELVHTSYVIPKCYKFPFLAGDDYEIGPCITYPEYRGNGYYPTMLHYISGSVGSEKTMFYMIVDENNIPSIKGIEKAGFERCGNIQVTKITKRYRLQ